MNVSWPSTFNLQFFIFHSSFSIFHSSSFIYICLVGEASWTKPLSVDDILSTVNGNNTTPVGEAEPSDLDWIAALDDVSGEEYWYNVQTGESTVLGIGIDTDNDTDHVWSLRKCSA